MPKPRGGGLNLGFRGRRGILGILHWVPSVILLAMCAFALQREVVSFQQVDAVTKHLLCTAVRIPHGHSADQTTLTAPIACLLSSHYSAGCTHLRTWIWPCRY